MQSRILSGLALLTAIAIPLASKADDKVSPAQEQLFRQVAPKFHQNFNAGLYDKNGPLVTADIAIDSNNVQLSGRDEFVKRIARFAVPFPGIQLRDRVIIVDGNVAADGYTMQAVHNGPFGDIAATGRKVEAMGGEIFEFSPEGLMKKLVTITELDRVKAEISGTVVIDNFQAIDLLPNGKASAAAHAKMKSVAAALDQNFNAGETAKNAGLATQDITINADNQMLVGRQAFVDYQERFKLPFPDMRITDEYVLAEGERAVVEFAMEGTQTGSMALPDGSTLPPTGRKARVRGLAFLKFDNGGLISEITYIQNAADFVAQLKQ